MRPRLRRSILAIVALLAPSLGWAQSARQDGIALGNRGNPIAGAPISICSQPAVTTVPPCSPLATLPPGTGGIPTISTAVRSSNTVTITTASAHGISSGVTVVVGGVTDGSFNGTFTVTANGATTFTYSQTGPNGSSSGGTVTGLNPISADSNGNYFWYGMSGQFYTVEIAGPQLNPPFVLRDQAVPGGAGTVTSFSAGNLSPLFTTSVSNPSSTPALGFALSNQNANTHLAGPASGGAAAPTFRSLVAADLPATTSNCSGVQFAQGLNAGGTPACATPPTFGASGASHAVGYVVDPGSTAGTTRFLREDATWQVPPAGTNGFSAPTTTTLGANISLTANTATTVVSQSLTMPPTGGPFRIQTEHWAYWTAPGGSGMACDTWVTDGTNNWAGSGTEDPVNGGHSGNAGSGVSTVTYSNSASVTLTFKISCNQAGTVTTGPFVTGAAGVTTLQSTVYASN